jgi:MinD-like ATPase involved in chromosome partitioning or flagellar assembly/CheY-like chemotaxis protein
VTLGGVSVPGNKILLVDADIASRNFVARTLQKQGHEVLQVGSAKEGLIAAWRDHPELIVIEPALDDLQGEDFAAKLRQDPRTARLPLIALSSDQNASRQKSCRDAGFNEYILKSGQAVSRLMDAVNDLLGLRIGGGREGGLLIVFLSAKGGTGASSLCANVAMNIAESQPEAKVAVADMVLPIGSIAPIVGYQDELDLVKVAGLSPGETDSNFFREKLSRLPVWQFYLLAGSPDPDSANELQGTRIGDLIRGLRSGFDFVVVDLGRSLSKISLPIIQNADLLVLIVSADAGAVALTRTLLEYLRAKGVGNDAIYAIVNRAVGLDGLTKPETEKMLDLPIKSAIPYLGGHLAIANNQHQPFTLRFPTETASIIFKDIAKSVVEQARQRRGQPEQET